MLTCVDRIAPTVEEQAAVLLATGKRYAEEAEARGEVVFLRAYVNSELFDHLTTRHDNDPERKRWNLYEVVDLAPGCFEVYRDVAEAMGETGEMVAG